MLCASNTLAEYLKASRGSNKESSSIACAYSGIKQSNAIRNRMILILQKDLRIFQCNDHSTEGAFSRKTAMMRRNLMQGFHVISRRTQPPAPLTRCRRWPVYWDEPVVESGNLLMSPTGTDVPFELT